MRCTCLKSLRVCLIECGEVGDLGLEHRNDRQHADRVSLAADIDFKCVSFLRQPLPPKAEHLPEHVDLPVHSREIHHQLADNRATRAGQAVFTAEPVFMPSSKAREPNKSRSYS